MLLKSQHLALCLAELISQALVLFNQSEVLGQLRLKLTLELLHGLSVVAQLRFFYSFDFHEFLASVFKQDSVLLLRELCVSLHLVDLV